MPAELEWVDEKRSIILCNLIGEFGIETYGAMEGELPMMVREVEHRLDIIFRLTARAGLPPIRGLLREIGILGNVMPSNFGVFVGVGDSLLLSNPVSVWVADVFVQRYYASGRVRVASSVDAAIAQIMGMR